jgi:hypothetical protein
MVPVLNSASRVGAVFNFKEQEEKLKINFLGLKFIEFVPVPDSVPCAGRNSKLILRGGKTNLKINFLGSKFIEFVPVPESVSCTCENK